MELWLIILIALEIVIFLLYVRYHKRYPILNMPFDYGYRVFKRAYRAYKPVRTGDKTLHIYAQELLPYYKNIVEGNTKASAEQIRVATRLIDIVENHTAAVTAYFNPQFNYKEYLLMMSEYDLTIKRQEINIAVEKTKQSRVPLFRKVIIFEALFRAAGIDTDATKKARFIRNLLEIEMDTEKIANTNIYKQLKKHRNAAEDGKETKSRCDDLNYAANELDTIGLGSESLKLRNEVDSYRE